MMPTKAVSPLLPVLLALALARPALAVETQTTVVRTADEVAKGEMDHLLVAADGSLALTLDHRRIAVLPDPVIWSIAARGNGSVVGTGNKGRVLAVANRGELDTLLDPAELETYAVAVRPDGTVLAATSPNGKVYAIDADGNRSTLFDPEERYIWALAVVDGATYVATGDPARLYRVDDAGNAVSLLETEEKHILSLAVSPTGAIVAGTAGVGYVYRIDGDEVTVLLDTAGSEVKGLAFDDNGNLYAAVTGSPAPAPAAKPKANGGGAATASTTTADLLTDSQSSPAATTVTVGATTAVASTPAVASPSSASASSAAAPSGSRQTWVYRIGTDGVPEEIYKSDKHGVLAIAWLDGSIVIGTDDSGRLLGIFPDNRETVTLLDLEAAQVTALSRDGDELLVATSNPAAVYRMTSEPADRGRYTSRIIDGGHHAIWGRLKVTSTGDVDATTRSGNTRTPGATWSDWATAGDGAITSPRARYIQYRLALDASGGDEPPRVRSVSLSLLPTNRAPLIDSITVLPPNRALLLDAPPATPPSQARNRSVKPNASPQPEPRDEPAQGSQSIRWKANDPDEDSLRHSLYFRGVGDHEWRLLADERRQAFYSFDATTLPDGRYEARVHVTDAPSNPPNSALTTSRTSEPFLIDNTPPTITARSEHSGDGLVRVRSTVTDSGSEILWGEYSLDAGRWLPVLPDDSVFDEARESITIDLDLEPGEHVVTLRVADAGGNIGTGRVVIRVD